MQEKELRKLLEKMSVKDKLGELWQCQTIAFDAMGVLTGGAVADEKFDAEEVWSCGSTLNLFDAEKIRAVQEDHLKHNKHKIPMMFMGDIIHGFTTKMPIPLASSCSFDMDLIKAANRVTAKIGVFTRTFHYSSPTWVAA